MKCFLRFCVSIVTFGLLAFVTNDYATASTISMVGDPIQSDIFSPNSPWSFTHTSSQYQSSAKSSSSSFSSRSSEPASINLSSLAQYILDNYHVDISEPYCPPDIPAVPIPGVLPMMVLVLGAWRFLMRRRAPHPGADAVGCPA